MDPIIEKVYEFLESQDWPYTPIEDDLMDEDEAGFRTAFTGDSGQFSCLGLVDEQKRMFVFYTFSPVKVAEDRLMAAMEFVTRANYDMYIGNFEMDLSDGEVRFKASVDFDEAQALAPVVKGVVFMSVLMMDRYFPGLLRVIYGEASAEQAIDEIEGGGVSNDQISA